MSTLLNIGTGTGGVATSGIAFTVVSNWLQGGMTGTLIDYLLTNNNSPADVQYLSLISGANTINATNCPALPQSGGVWLVPPSGNSVTITLKGVTGDTGIALSLIAPTFLPFAVSPPSSFVITTNNAITGFLFVWV